MKFLAIQLLNFLLLLQIILAKPLSEEENSVVINVDLNVGSEQDNSYFGAAIGEISEEMKEQMVAEEEDFSVDLWSLRDGSGAVPKMDMLDSSGVIGYNLLLLSYLVYFYF